RRPDAAVTGGRPAQDRGRGSGRCRAGVAEVRRTAHVPSPLVCTESTGRRPSPIGDGPTKPLPRPPARAPIPGTGPGTRAQAAPVLALIAGGHRARLPGAGLTRTASARLRPAWRSV